MLYFVKHAKTVVRCRVVKYDGTTHLGHTMNTHTSPHSSLFGYVYQIMLTTLGFSVHVKHLYHIVSNEAPTAPTSSL